MLSLLLLGGGAALLYVGAEALVSGAAGLALAFGVRQLVVGLTVVAYGTSAPEVVVGAQAALSGHGGIALGNVIGSNIANLGLVLGLSCLVKPAMVDGALRKSELPLLLLSTAAVPVVLYDGVLSTWESALLVLGAVVYTTAMVQRVRRHRSERSMVPSPESVQIRTTAKQSHLKLAFLALLGLLLVIVGGHVLVQGASLLARQLGLSERLVGLTVVAVGTSLPELATSLVAALRGHSELVIGNVVGSNIFNVLLCLGSAGLVGHIASPFAAFRIDLVVLGVITLLGVVFLRTSRRMTRGEGAVLLGSYATFIVLAVMYKA